MSNLANLILNVSFLDYFHALPNTLNAEKMFVFFDAIAYESIEYIVIIF